MKLSEAERFLSEQLKETYEPGEAAGIAALAIEHLTGFDRNIRSLKKEEPLTTDQQLRLNNILSRLQQHEPIQYIMNKAWFYGLELYVNSNVLIPRPETEELVDWIISDVRASGRQVFTRGENEADDTTGLKILDVGTGSGCIALALKSKMPLAEVWGCDISDSALNIARRNASELDIRVDFQSVDYLDKAQQKHLPTVDIVVSNPPYVPQSDKEDMKPNVLQYEPHTALFVQDNDPLVFYKAMVKFAEHRLYDKGRLYMEIHEGLGNQVVELFREAGFSKIELRQDMQGKDRMVRAAL